MSTHRSNRLTRRAAAAAVLAATATIGVGVATPAHADNPKVTRWYYPTEAACEADDINRYWAGEDEIGECAPLKNNGSGGTTQWYVDTVPGWW